LHLSVKVDKLDNVKLWHYIVAILLIMGIVYIYLHRQDLGLTASHGIETGESATLSEPSPNAKPGVYNWRRVDRDSEGFKIDMPADFKDIQVPAYNERGGTDEVEMIFANPEGETTFSLSWADNPPVVRFNGQSAERVLDMARDDALARTQTSVVGESSTTLGGLGGYPARDFVGKNSGGGVMNARLIFAAPRLYMLTVAYPSVNARREQDVVRFFNSFTITSPSRISETMPAASAPAR
jgi:hypothetical protein